MDGRTAAIGCKRDRRILKSALKWNKPESANTLRVRLPATFGRFASCNALTEPTEHSQFSWRMRRGGGFGVSASYTRSSRRTSTSAAAFRQPSFIKHKRRRHLIASDYGFSASRRTSCRSKRETYPPACDVPGSRRQKRESLRMFAHDWKLRCATICGAHSTRN
jgi:hypothetical protein